MSEQQAKPKSAAYALLAHVWKTAPRGSWLRLNSAMHAALRLAIESGMEFDPEDFVRFASDFRSHYWIGDSEWCYTAACQKNPSATRAYEKWAGRKPFIVHSGPPSRRHPKGEPKVLLHVGARFSWHFGPRQSLWVTVTSFCDKPDPESKGTPEVPYVVAVHHKPNPPGEDSRDKVAMLFRITHDDIKNYHAAIRKHLEMLAAQEKAGVEPDYITVFEANA